MKAIQVIVLLILLLIVFFSIKKDVKGVKESRVKGIRKIIMLISSFHLLGLCVVFLGIIFEVFTLKVVGFYVIILQGFVIGMRLWKENKVGSIILFCITVVLLACFYYFQDYFPF
ncbi:hypothetical protein [Bacillus alkalicellulosilyticus]|uniref:hypothetical protein n=1 Tax=Alkalihalobacterium alkalicellulosilyticum TaxID=1912214 RepID=UPI000996D8E9|nr:hypothetical protein [Bacillus alkalicellulosilyticus]